MVYVAAGKHTALWPGGIAFPCSMFRQTHLDKTKPWACDAFVARGRWYDTDQPNATVAYMYTLTSIHVNLMCMPRIQTKC